MPNLFGLGNAWDHTFGTKGAGGFLFGHGPQAIVPKDMQGMRQQNIDLMNAFLRPGAFDTGGAGANYFGTDAMSRFNAPTPEMETWNTLRPMLEGMMTGTGPQFERDIGMANATGGRFGSGNAIMRGEALRNLFNMRGQTAQTMGVLSGQAGASTFDRAMAMNNQKMQLIAGLFGMGQNATNFPVENNKGAFGDLLKIAASFYGGGGFGGMPGGARTASMPAGRPANPFGGMS